MRKIKNKHRRRTHLLYKVVLRTSWFQYTGRQMGPNKTETMCWLDGRYYSAPNTRGIYLERISVNMAEYKRLNSH